MFLVYFVRTDHFGNQVVEYGRLALGTVYPKAELVEISVYVKVAYPGVGRPDPRLDLVYHCVQGLEVRPVLAFYLVYIIGFRYGAVTFPSIGGDLRLTADIVDEDIL